LGILDIREPQILKRLDMLDADLKQLHLRIADKAAEPAFHITQLRSRLLNEYGVVQVDMASLNQGELFTISQVRDARLSNLQVEATEIERKIGDLDTQINGATARLNELHELHEQSVVAKEVTAIGSAVLERSEGPESLRQTILEKMDRLCPSGELVRECEKVNARLAELDDQIANKKPTDAQRQTLRTVQKRDQVEAGLGDQAGRRDIALEQIRARLKQLNNEKNRFLVRRGIVAEWQRLIPRVTDDLLRWHRVEQGEEPNQELTALRSQERQNVDQAEQLKQELTDLLAKQNERVRKFRQRFHGIVQRAINASFKGVVSVEREEVTFRISRERSLSGEAYETLAVLLADIAILMESSSESVCHPGLLIHDSPREADLNVRLYERMLETAYSLMSDGQLGTPYQYIVTTTTQPAEALRSANVTKEVLSSGIGSLFGMQLEVARDGDEGSTLFNQKGDS
jgi:chaperonin cofactor prefoldin